MLSETMLALRVTDMEYAPEIARLIRAGAQDLRMAGVRLDGRVNITVTITGSGDEQVITANDTSTIEDDSVKTAIMTYCKARFGNNPNADRLEASYRQQREQLANASGYTDFLEEVVEP